MRDRQAQFQRLVETFSEPLRDCLPSIRQNSGMLDARHCTAVSRSAGMSPASLMVRLLPVARLYARVPISHFPVGAIARARLADGPDEFALFMGANIEFAGQALVQTIHAEQAAVVNAWHQGAVQIDAVAVSAAPCGRCRQFLHELETARALTVIVEQPEKDGYTTELLSDLLPQAFGPQDLAVKASLLSFQESLPKLRLKTVTDDPLVRRALTAAAQSYAPYTRNLAGCAIQVEGDKIHTGSYLESAAFNPSLSPLHTAIIGMHMGDPAADGAISRAVLVEKSTAISQRGVCELLLASLAAGIRLAYYEIE